MEMATGQDLDRRVAEAMNRRDDHKHGITRDLGQTWLAWFDTYEEANRWLGENRALFKGVDLHRMPIFPDYSTDPAMVGPMLEWCHANNLWVWLENEDFNWEARVARPHEQDTTPWRRGSSPQCALARAIAATAASPAEPQPAGTGGVLTGGGE